MYGILHLLVLGSLVLGSEILFTFYIFFLYFYIFQQLVSMISKELANSLFSSRLADIPSPFKPQTICNCCLLVCNSECFLFCFVFFPKLAVEENCYIWNSGV